MPYENRHQDHYERITRAFDGLRLHPVFQSAVTHTVIDQLVRHNALPANRAELCEVRRVPNKKGQIDGTSLALGLIARCGWSADFLVAPEYGPERPNIDPYNARIERVFANTPGANGSVDDAYLRSIETFPFGDKGLGWDDSSDRLAVVRISPQSSV
jgi:hypothetical protein